MIRFYNSGGLIASLLSLDIVLGLPFPYSVPDLESGYFSKETCFLLVKIITCSFRIGEYIIKEGSTYLKIVLTSTQGVLVCI